MSDDDRQPADPSEPADPPTPPSGGATDSEAAPGTARSGGEGRATARRWPVAALVLGVLAVVAVALAVLQRNDAADLRDERADRREVARVASAFGEAYLTYDYADVEASSAAVRALATDSFAAEFESTSAPGIQELFASNETSTEATVQDVFVGEVADGRARALVVVDVEASSTATGGQRLSNLSFVLDLVREGGDWRVSAVAPAPRPDISDPTGGTSPPPSTTSTTTVTTTPEEATP